MDEWTVETLQLKEGPPGPKGDPWTMGSPMSSASPPFLAPAGMASGSPPKGSAAKRSTEGRKG